MADISDVVMEPHHVIRDRISVSEQNDGMSPQYVSVDEDAGSGVLSTVPYSSL